MNEKLLEYMNIPNIKAEEVKRLIEIDEEMRILKDQVDVITREGGNPSTKRGEMIKLRREHLYLKEQLIDRNISGIPKELWNKFGKKVGNKKRSSKIVELVEGFVRG